MYVIRCDEGNAVNGHGHEVRCRAIADELEKLGQQVVWQGNVAHNDTVIYDCRNDWLKRDHGYGDIRIVAIDDPFDRRLEADVAFYPPTPQALRLDWTGSDCEVHIGWKWLPMRELPEPKTIEERSGVFIAKDSFGLLKGSTLVGSVGFNGDNYLDAMNSAASAICAGGMTGYELHALHVPSVHLAPNADVVESSAALRDVPFGAIDGHGARRIAELLVRG